MQPRSQNGSSWSLKRVILLNFAVFLVFCFFYFNPETETSTSFSSKNSFLFSENSTLNKPGDPTPSVPEEDSPTTSNPTQDKTKEDPLNIDSDKLKNSSKNETKVKSPNGKENPPRINNPPMKETEEESLEEKENPSKSDGNSTPLEKNAKNVFSNLHLEKMMPSDREGPSAFLDQGGIIDQKDARSRILCNLQQSQRCSSKSIAEHLDLMWTFSPIYSPFPERMPFLYKTHGDFVGYMKSFGIKSVVLEAIYPGQNFTFTTAGNEPWEIQLEVEDYIYYRENFLNVAIRKTWHLDYEYILWIDAHQIFLNPYWWEDGIYKLARYPTVSFFQSLTHINGSENNSTFKEGLDMGGVQYLYQQTSDLHYWISGYGRWAAWNGNAVGIRKEIYEKIDYIIDYCIEACCDCAFNAATMTFKWNLMDSFGGYGKSLKPWIESAKKTLAGENGVVRGKMIHLYHEHIWHDGAVFRRLVNTRGLDLWNELYRDENFTIHIKKESFLKRLKTKPDRFPVN